MRLVLVLALALLPAIAAADMPRPPKPQSWTSPDGKKVIDVYPTSTTDVTASPIALVYEVTRDKADLIATAKLVWKGSLAQAPAEVALLNDGRLVTFDGYHQGIAVYDACGKRLAEHPLATLLPQETIVEDRMSGRGWRRYAQYMLDKDTLWIRTTYGLFEIALADGKIAVERNSPRGFPKTSTVITLPKAVPVTRGTRAETGATYCAKK